MYLECAHQKISCCLRFMVFLQQENSPREVIGEDQRNAYNFKLRRYR